MHNRNCFLYHHLYFQFFKIAYSYLHGDIAIRKSNDKICNFDLRNKYNIESTHSLVRYLFLSNLTIICSMFTKLLKIKTYLIIWNIDYEKYNTIMYHTAIAIFSATYPRLLESTTRFIKIHAHDDISVKIKKIKSGTGKKKYH